MEYEQNTGIFGDAYKVRHCIGVKPWS